MKNIKQKQLLNVLLATLTMAQSGCVEDSDYSSEDKSVVYGDDSRIEVYQAARIWQEHVHQTSIQLIGNDQLRSVPQGFETVDTTNLETGYNICPDERFADQPIQGFCSATLIDDDLVLTAGHCISSCTENVSFVFGRYYTGAGQLDNFYPTEDVYGCGSVEISSSSTSNFGRGLTPDWAIVKLDRPVSSSHQPAAIGDSRDLLELGDPLALIGYPSAIPAKIDFGGRVTDEGTNQASEISFEGTVDAFGGNSGSGVFTHDRTLVGILTAGRTDYVLDSAAGCNRVNVFPQDSSNAETIHSAQAAVDEYCLEHTNENLCDKEETTPPTASTCIDTPPAGDGWGWNGTESCRVGETTTPPVIDPQPSGDCEDTAPLGDGWGWNGTESCRVGETTTPPVIDPQPSEDCEDTAPLGDGWGWNGTDSCRVGETTTPPVIDPQPTGNCVDTAPAGDGFGWNGTETCIVPRVIPCEDTPPVGDGFGWNGDDICVIQDPADIQCADTPPIGDGWGWNGTDSCRV